MAGPVIDKRLTITGPGAAQLTVDAGGKSQVFYVVSTTATISGLTISGGLTADGTGGGVSSYESDLTLDQVVVTGNGAGYGGGIHAERGSLTVTSSTIMDNAAASGGGGVAGQYALLALTDCQISGNVASYWGGGIYNDRGGRRWSAAWYRAMPPPARAEVCIRSRP